MSELADRYPRTVSCDGTDIQLEILDAVDSDELKAFTAGLPETDLLFLSRDIREPKVVAAWSNSIASGDLYTIAARQDGKIVGTTAVVLDKYSWSAHVGELRILVLPEARGIGLGRTLIQEAFLMGIDLGLEKLTVRVVLGHDQVLAVFEEMGFKTEAMFRDHVKDPSGNTHDILILSHNVAGIMAKMQAFGMEEAF